MKTRNRKKTLYRRVVFRMVMVSVLLGAGMIALFYGMEMRHIRNRAETALTESVPDTWSEDKQVVSDVRSVCITDAGTEGWTRAQPEGLEQELMQYYQLHRQEIPLGQVGYFRNSEYAVYFFPCAINSDESDPGDVLLLYTDVSFTVNTVRLATGILILAMVLIAGLLYYAGCRTINALNEKDESMKTFFSNASHELKTPLMAIRGYADGIRAGIVEPDKACSVICKETERMTELVNDILEFSKLDSGVAQSHMAENDVREILYDAAGVIEPIAEQNGIQISMDLPEPLLYHCDEDMLFSVFSNILTNSLRYAESEISVCATKQKTAPHLNVRISNDGAVISQEALAHLFERFYKGKGGQTGIGMALSLEYVKLHQGDIVVSTAGGRTVFEVVLP